MSSKIEINVSGAIHSGKGYVIAAITKTLRDAGINVVVQAENTHNKEKIEKSQEEVFQKIKEKDIQIVITEMQTAK